MPDQPYTAREGIYRATYGGRKWLAASPPGGAAFGGERKPCLVVTGDLDVVRRRLDPPPTLPSFRKVAGTCPACSGSTLMLGAGDHVTCSWIGCPDPMAARRRLAQPAVSDDTRTRAAHVIAEAMFGWTNVLGVETGRAVVDALAAAGLLRAAPTDAAIEHVAARLWVECGETMYHGAWERVDGYLRRKYLGIARAALAAAEENTDG